MPFAMQLFIDPASDTVVRSVWKELASTGKTSYMHDSGNRPHFSLAIYSELENTVCQGRLQSFAEQLPPFGLIIQSLGLFHSDKAVMFLAPVVTARLLDLHLRVHQLLQDIGTSPAANYLPERWTPHCTLANHISTSLVSQVVEVGLRLPFPLSFHIEEIGVIEYPPVKHLFAFRLAGG